MQAISLRDLEILVLLGHGTLQLDVLRNDVVGHIAARRHKVTPSPKVPTPEGLTQGPKLSHEPIRSLSLDGLHHTARRQMRRYTQEEVHVVLADVPLQNLDVVPTTYLPNQFPKPKCHVSTQHRLAVLGYEYKMVVQLVDGVGRLTVVPHGGIVPKYRKHPKGFA